MITLVREYRFGWVLTNAVACVSDNMGIGSSFIYILYNKEQLHREFEGTNNLTRVVKFKALAWWRHLVLL